MDNAGLTMAGPSRTPSFASLPPPIGLIFDKDEQHGQVPMKPTLLLPTALPERTAGPDEAEMDHHQLLRRIGGGTQADQNIAQTGETTSATSTGISMTPTTYSDLFPTASQTASSGDGGRGTNVYYLVFLGVLVILLCVAACLTYRAFRIRRRYRTATQRAIARGDRLPPELTGDRDDFWGLGGLAGWNSDGMDRFPLGAGGHALVGGAKSKWQRVPVLWEHAVEPEPAFGDAVDGRTLVGESSRRKATDIWGDTQPVSVQSLLPPDEEIDPATIPSNPRLSGPRPRPSPRLHLSSFGFGHRRRLEDQYAAHAETAEEEKVPEMDRYLEDGEEMRIGVIIEMPTEDREDVKQKNYVDSEDGTEEIGWKPNMELGVWEGSAKRRYR